jgi:RNA polymerase sigma-70 factor (ECF subfamily)
MRIRRRDKYKNHSDEQLVILMNRDNEGAFRELYGRYKERIFYYFYRMLGNSHQKAQDFLQDLFMKLIEKAEYFNPDRKFSTWIFSIAHNMCKNEYRRLSKDKLTTKQQVPDIFEEETAKEEKQLIDLSDKIFETLEQFDEEHKTCFLLKYREGFSVDEISNIMDISKGTVKSRLFYTRQKLKHRFEPIYREIQYDK